MVKSPGFPHLPLPLRFRGQALLPGGGKQSAQTRKNRDNFATHAANLTASAKSASANWKQLEADRLAAKLPAASEGIPILLQVDPNLELGELLHKFGFEIVAEQEDGFVIVASEDGDLTALLAMINKFATDAYGSATIASIHRLFDDPTHGDRLKRILSEGIYKAWPSISDDELVTYDFGISVLGSHEIPKRPTRGKRDTDATWAAKEEAWHAERSNAYQRWDDLRYEREKEMGALVAFYRGEVLDIVDDTPVVSHLPDSFTMRITVCGKGLRDIVLSSPHLFEVVEPDDIGRPPWSSQTPPTGSVAILPQPPPATAPTVCVIDSGIQEAHQLLSPAIDQGNSHSFLPGGSPTNVGDYVRPGGHGTRVAGAVLYGEFLPTSGQPTLELWLQNARVLDNNCKMPLDLFPPAAIRAVVARFNSGPRQTRLFNHSINSGAACRLRHMSAWAAEIDALCEQRDVLIVQSAGNIELTALHPRRGVREHIALGREYPDYLDEPGSRVSNPAQSLQALTVGSVAYGAFEDADWRSIAAEPGQPSAFSRSGFGIWDVIKPEVVEYGGDGLRSNGSPADIGTPSHAGSCYPELVRSTMYPPGPSLDRDEVGTSFSAPKVSRIAAKLQETLPSDSCLLYRALIVQSARWPEWTKRALDHLAVLRRIGYGIPDMERATRNTEYRTTLVSSKDPKSEDDLRIKAGECHVFQVPIPESLRRPGADFDILIEVTLSYVAQPRRTRRNLRRYLSTWVSWTSSKLEEPIEKFRKRAMKGQDDADGLSDGTPIQWMLHEKPNWGAVRGTKRSAGTLQKDWALVKSNQLPDNFCIAVVGHKGWSSDPDSSARYALAVSFEATGRDVTIYDEVRVALDAQQIEAEAEADVY